MASTPITIYTLKTDEATYVGGPELFEAYGLKAEDVPGLLTHTIVLKPRFCQSMQDEVERAVKVVNPASGLIVPDESKRAGAMVEQYVESWDFCDESFITEKNTEGKIAANATGYVKLEPLVAAEVRNRLSAKVFPSLTASPDFFSAVLAKQAAKSALEASSETQTLTSQTPTAE